MKKLDAFLKKSIWLEAAWLALWVTLPMLYVIIYLELPLWAIIIAFTVNILSSYGSIRVRNHIKDNNQQDGQAV